MIPYCAISNSLRKSKSCLPFFFLLLLLLGSSCKGKNREENESDDSIEKVSLKVKYAQFFSIDNLPLGHRIKIYNPSNGALLQSLVLIPSKEAKTFTPQEGEEVIAVPCKRLALLSDTFVGAIELLDARERSYLGLPMFPPFTMQNYKSVPRRASYTLSRVRVLQTWSLLLPRK